MDPTITTCNAGRRTAAPRGGRTGGQAGRGGGRTGDQGAQGGDHISNQGINGSRNNNPADDSVHGDVRNVNTRNGRSGCSYKDFWHSRGREAAVGMSWDDFKALMKEEYCLSNEMQKLEMDFWNHAMVGAGHAVYID
nr:reverse transcriptase domain-containing protein [Tanacetum cinerariifolium]